MGTHIHQSSSYELTLHFIRSPVGISWRSPKSLLFSTFINILCHRLFFFGHPIGHVHIELCQKSVNKNYLTGISIADLREYSHVLLNEGQGFGALFYRFRGRLESEQEIIKSLKWAKRFGRLRSLNFLISEEAFLRLEEYFLEIKKMDLQYGFPCEPRKKEGAGCTAFAMSFLEIAGLVRDDYFAWKKTVFIPQQLIGDKTRIPFLKALRLALLTDWATASEGRALHFWDPDAMYAWVKSRSSGVVSMDMSQSPVPEESIWL